MTKVSELFGYSVEEEKDWALLVREQQCPYTESKCSKTRKGDSSFSIGTCTMKHGLNDVMICPTRLLQNNTVFNDITRLIEPNDKHYKYEVTSEIQIAGGNVDFFLVSKSIEGEILDYVGIEFQTLDTTGTVMPERERFLASQGSPHNPNEISKRASFGMNWKMTAKTILVQILHKIKTFDDVNKKLVLVVQDPLLDYMETEFDFSSFSTSSSLDNNFFIFSYSLETNDNCGKELNLSKIISTNKVGVERSMSRLDQTTVEEQAILDALIRKMSNRESRTL